jgi:polysaccharide pyruvyl transferase WcaK-like protein
MEAVLAHLRCRHPDAVIDAMCAGPETVAARYGIDAVPMFWFDRHQGGLSRRTARGLKILSRPLDVFRVAAWVRRHDAVIVPGAGVLEASLPLRPWDSPYAFFLLSAAGRVFGTKVAFVSVGAGSIRSRATRWFSNWAARLAFYRSYRDAGSREAMRRRGVRAPGRIVPDLAFALPVPEGHRHGEGDWSTIGVGIMDYHGSNDDRRRADEIRASYVLGMTAIVRWLVEDGRRVRLFIGDTNGSDEAVAQEVLGHLHRARPDLEGSWVVAEPVASLGDIMNAMEPLGAVIATRYHNLIAALRLSKPTIAVGYSPKHAALMSDMGLASYCNSVGSLDVGVVAQQLLEMEASAGPVRASLAERNRQNLRVLEQHFAEVDELVLGLGVPGGSVVGGRSMRAVGRRRDIPRRAISSELAP